MRISFCVIVQKQILLLLDDDSKIWLRSDGILLPVEYSTYFFNLKSSQLTFVFSFYWLVSTKR